MEVGELWVKLGLDKSNFDTGVNDAKTQSGGLASFIKGAFEFTVGQGIFDALKEGLKSAWDMSIGYNSELQQNKIALDTMAGSADKAGQLLKQLEQFAAETPFQFPELADASKKMLAFGFSASQVMPILKSVGDAASGLGMSGSEGLNRLTEALGKIKTMGKVTSREMLELTSAGVPAWDILAKAMGKSTDEVRKLTEKGLIPADTAINALVQGMEDKFPNMMDKQSKSFIGLMSTLKDNVEMTLGQVMKPAFNELTNTILPALIKKVQEISTAFKLNGMKGVLNEIFPSGLANIISGIGSAIKNTTSFLSQHTAILKTAVVIMASIVVGIVAYKAALVALAIAEGVTKAQQEISNALMVANAIARGGLAAGTEALATAEGSATLAQWGLNAAMSANPIGLVIAGIAALVTAVVGLTAIFDKSKQKRQELSDSIKKNAQTEQKAEDEALEKEEKAAESSITSRRNAEETAHSARLQQIQDTYNAEVEAAQKSEQAQKDAIEKEKQSFDDAMEERKQKLYDEHQQVMDNLSAEYEAKQRLIDQDMNNEIDALNDKIKAIDNQTKQEEKSETDAKNQEEIQQLKSKLNSARTASDKATIIKQLADKEKEINKQKINDEREAEKAALNKQIEDIRTNAEKKKQSLQDELKVKEDTENKKYTAVTRELDKEKTAYDRSMDDKKNALDDYAENAKKVYEKDEKAAQDAENAKYNNFIQELDNEESALQDSYQKRKQNIDDYYTNIQDHADEQAKKQVPGFWENLWSGIEKSLGKAFSNFSFNWGAVGGMGGFGYASGTDYATPGTHLVGENGPEIIQFGGGEKVYNADETKSILGKGLYLIITNFYNNREQDIEALSHELKFYWDKLNKGKGRG